MVSPIVAAIISFFFPGIGQVVQGETKKGIIMFVAAIVLSIILTYALGTIGNIIYLIYAMMLIIWDKLIFIHFIFL